MGTRSTYFTDKTGGDCRPFFFYWTLSRQVKPLLSVTFPWVLTRVHHQQPNRCHLLHCVTHPLPTKP